MSRGDRATVRPRQRATVRPGDRATGYLEDSPGPDSVGRRSGASGRLALLLVVADLQRTGISEGQPAGVRPVGGDRHGRGAGSGEIPGGDHQDGGTGEPVELLRVIGTRRPELDR